MVHLQRGQVVNYCILALILTYRKATSLLRIVPLIPNSEPCRKRITRVQNDLLETRDPRTTLDRW